MPNNLNPMGSGTMSRGAPRFPNARTPAGTNGPVSSSPVVTNGGGLTMDPPLVVQGPPPATDKGYIPNFLSQNIGRQIRAEFIIGSNQYVDKTGILTEVGVNYFVIEDPNTRARTMSDLYSVKFVTVAPEGLNLA